MWASSESALGQEFTATHWSEIQAARTASPDRRQAVLDNLARRYWRPIYHYLRARGFQDAEARDITQDFFVEIILARDLFGQADSNRGRFRPYLLHCLKNYVRERHRRQRASCRSPSRPAVSIDQWTETGDPPREPPAPHTSPEDAFHRNWAASLLEQAVGRLRASCEESGRHIHFSVFEERFIRPALEQVAPTPLKSLAQRFDLTPRQAANRGETARRRFRRLLLDEVRLTVSDENAAQEELRSLLERLRH